MGDVSAVGGEVDAALSVDLSEVHPKRTFYLTVVNYGAPICALPSSALGSCHSVCWVWGSGMLSRSMGC